MLNVGVIGLGQIAAMYSHPGEKLPYCHVGGIRLSDKVQLVAAADLSEKAIEKFLSVWGDAFPNLSLYRNTEEMFSKEQLDIIAVCVRGPYHFQVMKDVLREKPKAVFLEKPPTSSLAEMDELLADAEKYGIPITVSYSRHWNPHILHMQQLVKQGLIGEVKTVIGYCGQHVLSFASHTTDLICQFAGYCPKSVSAKGTVAGECPPEFEVEPVLDNMIIEFENGVTGIQVGQNGEYGSFYAEVYGTKGNLRIGMYTPTVLRNQEGELLDLEQYSIPKNESVFKVAYEQIADYLNGGILPHCTNLDFVKVNEIGFAAIESILTGRNILLSNQNRTRRIYANG